MRCQELGNEFCVVDRKKAAKEAFATFIILDCSVYAFKAILAAVKVFLSSIVIVIGPTPPGTGVI